uniref:Uncharacterized protein n=1 Tax=Steinernema glaseri TaxID=37863 RepID=A0A1I7YL78_9BILA
MEDLTDNEFNEYTTILKKVAEVANTTFNEDTEDFDGMFTEQQFHEEAAKINTEDFDGMFTEQQFHEEAAKISPKIYEKIKAESDRIKHAIEELQSESARAAMNEVFVLFRDVRAKMWNRRYFLKVLLKGITIVQNMSPSDKAIVRVTFPHVIKFVEDETTKVLISKSTDPGKGCDVEDLLREMVDEAKYRLKNNRPMTEDVVLNRTEKLTTVRCPHKYVPSHALD